MPPGATLGVTGFSFTFTDSRFTPARILLMDEDSDLEPQRRHPHALLLSPEHLSFTPCLRKSYVETTQLCSIVICADVLFREMADFYLFVSETGFYYVTRAVLELSL